MGVPIVVTNSKVTRRMMLTGAASMLLGAVDTNSVSGAELSRPANTSTVGMATYAVRQKEVPVFFVTNRPATGSTDLSNQFGFGHGDAQSGCVRVLVTSNLAQRKNVPSCVVALRSQTFKEMAMVASRRQPKRTAIVFLHGYNNTFDDAVVCAGNLKHDLQTPSSIFAVAWNSQGSSLGYARDAEETWFTEKLVRGLLTDLLSAPEFNSVQLVAHSMGNRSLVAALANIARSSDTKLLGKISRVVLAAPDVDIDIMNAEYIPVAERYGFTTTLYVSSKDVMMRISEFWNGWPRVGGAWSTIYLNRNVDTIDVSDVDETVLGHSTIFQSSRLAGDMYHFLENGLPIQARFPQNKMSIQGGTYWKMAP